VGSRMHSRGPQPQPGVLEDVEPVVYSVQAQLLPMRKHGRCAQRTLHVSESTTAAQRAQQATAGSTWCSGQLRGHQGAGPGELFLKGHGGKPVKPSIVLPFRAR